MDDVDPSFRNGLTALLCAIAAFGAVDLALDQPASWLSFHVLFEVAFVAICLGAVVLLWRGWMGARSGLHRTEQRLQAREQERDLWRARADHFLRGLGAEIDAQLTRWSLTPTEKEVALLLLKGLGHKQVAELMERSERTVRQHAVAVYRKSGCAGRAELAAFFLEDLLLPQPPAGEASDSASGA
jgi:DNA-binding CsgD family transcriptional regulator